MIDRAARQLGGQEIVSVSAISTAYLASAELGTNSSGGDDLPARRHITITYRETDRFASAAPGPRPILDGTSANRGVPDVTS
jgi:hypothetical protein